MEEQVAWRGRWHARKASESNTDPLMTKLRLEPIGQSTPVLPMDQENRAPASAGVNVWSADCALVLAPESWHRCEGGTLLLARTATGTKEPFMKVWRSTMQHTRPGKIY